MFDRISSSLQKIFKNLRGYGKLTETNIQEAMREVRLALLEADVNYQVARDFIARVKEKCLGRDVLDSITPGQQVIKHVHEEMVVLLGGTQRDFDLSTHPAFILLLGLHGSGKTTTAGKLALHWKKSGKRVALVACDLRRPAAVDQLRILARQVGVDVITPTPGEALPDLGRRALEEVRKTGADIVIFDTGGRFQIDVELVQELKDLGNIVQPRNVILVVDAAVGQESVNMARTFHQEVGLTGLILTKLDGDARGGAALSIQSVTGCPILRIGMGEKMEDLEPFYPDRMASRILGMGDVVSLVEKAREAVDEKAMAEMEEKIMGDTFTLEDFLDQLLQMRKLGSMEEILEMMPGGLNVPGQARAGLAETSEKESKKAEAIIRSMTARERRHPELLDASRRRRIARGSGTQVQDVNELLKKFDQSRKMAKQLKKAQKRLLRFKK